MGGPAIVFHRYHEKDKIVIRNEREMCNTIQGWDAKSLYLHVLDQPCNSFTICREENNFKIEKRDKYLKALHWMEFLTKSEKSINNIFSNKGKYMFLVLTNWMDPKRHPRRRLNFTVVTFTIINVT